MVNRNINIAHTKFAVSKQGVLCVSEIINLPLAIISILGIIIISLLILVLVLVLAG